MWCFGVMIYYISTGVHFLPMDAKQEIAEKEVKLLINWDQTKLAKCLEQVPTGWEKIKVLLRQLMQPNPLQRPQSWSDILHALDDETKNDDLRKILLRVETNLNGVSDAISLQGEEWKARDEHAQTLLNCILRKVDEIPSLMVELQNVTCPYLFRFVTKPTPKKAGSSSSAPVSGSDIASEIGSVLTRADTLLTDTTNMVAKVTGTAMALKTSPVQYVSTLAKKKAKQYIQEQMGITQNVIYLELLCGWTLETAVTYTIKYTDYPAEVLKYATLGASLCSVALKAAVLWDTAAQGARMFGFPLPFVPKAQVQQGVNFFDGMSKKPEFTSFDEHRKMNLEVLSAFDRFLMNLEKNQKQTKWKDVMCPAVANLVENGVEKKQITFIAKGVSDTIGGDSYYKELRSKGEVQKTSPVAASPVSTSAPPASAPVVGAPHTGDPPVVNAPPAGAPPVVNAPPAGAPPVVSAPPPGAPPVVSAPPPGAPVVSAPHTGAPPAGAPVVSAPHTGTPPVVSTPPARAPPAASAPPSTNANPKTSPPTNSSSNQQTDLTLPQPAEVDADNNKLDNVCLKVGPLKVSCVVL